MTVKRIVRQIIVDVLFFLKRRNPVRGCSVRKGRGLIWAVTWAAARAVPSVAPGEPPPTREPHDTQHGGTRLHHGTTFLG